MVELQNCTFEASPLPLRKSPPKVMSDVDLKKAIYVTQPYTESKQLCIPVVPKQFYTERGFKNGDLFTQGNIDEDDLDDTIEYFETTGAWVFNIQPRPTESVYENMERGECIFCSTLTYLKTHTFDVVYNPAIADDNEDPTPVDLETSTWDEKCQKEWRSKNQVFVCSYCLSDIVGHIYYLLEEDTSFQTKYLIEKTP
jgi:hypothetical protein